MAAVAFRTPWPSRVHRLLGQSATWPIGTGSFASASCRCGGRVAAAELLMTFGSSKTPLIETSGAIWPNEGHDFVKVFSQGRGIGASVRREEGGAEAAWNVR